MRLPLLLLVGTILLSAVSGCKILKKNASGEKDSAPPPFSLSITRSGAADETTVDTSDAETSTEGDAEEQKPAEQHGVVAYQLQSGDPVAIYLRGIYPKDELIEDVVDEQGNLSLPHIGDIVASGKSTAQLEAEIRKLYIEGSYYRTISVNVVLPQQSCFIRGEVKIPGRIPISGGLTILQAIASAGGYTEFASPRNVRLIRGGTTQEVNMRSIEKNPENDIRLESGDVIVVGRSIL